jgi:hypothetical protein
VSRRAIGIIIAIVGIGIAIVGIFSIRQILTLSFAPAPVTTQTAPETEKVVVVTRDYAVGDVIASDSVRLEDIPVSLIPRNAVRNTAEVIDRIVKVPLVASEMVLEHHLADPTNISHDIGFTMSNNVVMMAFPATDLMSSINVLQRGDLVDILVTLEETVAPMDEEAEGEPVVVNEGEEETVSRFFTFDALQAQQMSAVIADIEYEEGSYASVPLEATEEIISSTEPYPSSVRVKSYLLILNPQDALVLKHLLDIGGTFDLVLRAPNNFQLFDLQPVISEYLIDRYQLEVPK